MRILQTIRSLRLPVRPDYAANLVIDPRVSGRYLPEVIPVQVWTSAR
jgi:hypothetical protein